MNGNDIFCERVKRAVEASRDMWQICDSFGFLNPVEQSLAAGIFRRENFFAYSFWGGYEAATRKCLVVGNEYEVPRAELAFLKVCPDKFNNVEHRDYMGAVLGLGIDRRIIGDIIELDDKCAYITVYDKNGMADYITKNLTKVGRATVKITAASSVPEFIPCFEELQTIVTSLRADCVAAAIMNSSRSEAQSIFRTEGIFVNNCLAQPSLEIASDDEFSVRGYGKYKFCGVVGQTRKDRLRIKLKKYTTFTERKENK